VRQLGIGKNKARQAVLESSFLVTYRLRPAFYGALLFCRLAGAQPAPAPAPAKPEVPADVLGRDNPRGTVLGFLNVSRKGDFETAAKYLNTRLTGKAAADLAHDLFTILDLRLPPRLNEISDRPEGSRADLGNPDQDLVGAITTDTGKVNIFVERVTRGKNPPVWLFSSKTLDSVPDLTSALQAVPVETLIPAFLVQARIGQIPIFQILALVVGLPGLYALTVLLGRALKPQVGRLRRYFLKRPDLPDIELLPIPIRLLLLAGVIVWALSRVGLPLLARQFWSTIAWVLTVAACVWLFVLFNDYAEGRLRRRLERLNNAGAATILHLGRRVVDILVIFIGVLIVVYHFGFNPTAALAGLGIGGIAVAFAAQKTLENVIGGISIIFDQVVRVGDFINAGGTSGTVESIGLRSARIRTLDRTLVSVPNGLISGVTLENVSNRDKFWFHHKVGLRYETTAAQMRSIVASITDLLTRHSRVERDSLRVRFLAFGPSSLDVEVFAYIFALGWPHFLEIQGELLLQIMQLVESAGAQIAFPSQTMYLETSADSTSECKETLLQDHATGG